MSNTIEEDRRSKIRSLWKPISCGLDLHGDEGSEAGKRPMTQAIADEVPGLLLRQSITHDAWYWIWSPRPAPGEGPRGKTVNAINGHELLFLEVTNPLVILNRMLGRLEAIVDDPDVVQAAREVMERYSMPRIQRHLKKRKAQARRKIERLQSTPAPRLP